MGKKPVVPIPTIAPTGLADALFTPVQQRVPGLVFGQPDRRFQSGNTAGHASNCRATVRICCQSCALVTPSTPNAVMHASSRPRRASSPSTACDSELRTELP